MITRRVDTLVIGGGIAGLSCALCLQEAARDVLLLDAGDAPGGVMQTVVRDGFLLEQGPFNVLVRSPEFVQLLAEFGPDAEPMPVSAAGKRNRFLLHDGELRRVPVSPADVLRTPLLSGRAKRRLLRGMLWGAPSGDEASIDEIVRRRFGEEIAERLASAVTIGTMAAESHELECASSLPSLATLDEWRSPLYGLLRTRLAGGRNGSKGTRGNWRGKASKPHGMVSFKGGLGGLAAALARRLGDAVQMNTHARAIERNAEGDFRIHAVQVGRPIELRAQHIVTAVGAGSTADLVAPLCRNLADELRQIDHVSLTVLNIAFKRNAIGHSLDGYGFLVPYAAREFPLLGVLWASSVFEHHAPPGQALLRVFVGGTRHPDLAHARDDVLLETVLDSLKPLLDVKQQPTLVNICRWPNAVPIYRPGHARTVRRIRSSARRITGLHLAGSYLDGVSVNACATRGVQVARQILQGERP